MTDAPRKRPAFEPAARLLIPTLYNPDMPRPMSTLAGFLLVVLRVLIGTIVLIGIAVDWDALLLDDDTGLSDSPELSHLALVIVASAGAAVLLVDLVFGFFVLRGSNIARVIVLLVSVVSIIALFIGWWVEGQEITLRTTFISLSLDILILLALSSRSSAAYARRNERRVD